MKESDMAAIDTLFARAKLADGTLNDIGVAAGRIVSIRPTGSAQPCG